MPAIAGCDDVYARLLSGLVLTGVPDATRGGVAPGPEGQLNVENLLQAPTAGEGLLLELPGFGGTEAPSLVYSVRLVRNAAAGAGAYAVEVRCAETLFHHLWPTTEPEALAGTLIQSVRAHHAAFLAWAAAGGEVTYAERLGLPALPVEMPDLRLVRFLAGLYREGKTLAEGPARGWWAPATLWSGQITTGEGKDPTYHLGPRTEELTAEEREHAGRLENAGWACTIYGALCGVFEVMDVGYQGWRWWLSGSIPWGQMLAAVGGALGVALWLAAGQALVRRQRRWFFADRSWTRWMIAIGAIYGMIPCAGWCCLGGLPVGGVVLYLLFDERTERVL